MRNESKSTVNLESLSLSVHLKRCCRMRSGSVIVSLKFGFLRNEMLTAISVKNNETSVN